MSTVDIQKMEDSDSDTGNNKSTVDSVKTEKKDNFFIKFLEDNKLIIPLAVVGVATVGMAVYSFSRK
jgi:hypothetical protein